MENKMNISQEDRPNRCVLVMNDTVSGGYLANAIAVIALTVGERHPYLVGAPLVDASGVRHPGLIPIGIPMLRCDSAGLKEMREKALEKGYDVVDFPRQGQQTKDYDEFLDMMLQESTGNLEYLGIAIIGKKNGVNRLTKHCEMIK